MTPEEIFNTAPVLKTLTIGYGYCMEFTLRVASLQDHVKSFWVCAEHTSSEGKRMRTLLRYGERTAAWALKEFAERCEEGYVKPCSSRDIPKEVQDRIFDLTETTLYAMNPSPKPQIHESESGWHGSWI